MVHGMPLKNVSEQSYKATIRTFGSSLVNIYLNAIRKCDTLVTLATLTFKKQLYVKFLCFDDVILSWLLQQIL